MYRAALATLAILVALPAAASADAACLVTANAGIDPADAETVASIVCSQLRKEGIAVGEPVYEASGERWRVSLRPLGSKVFLAVQHIHADNTVANESELLLTNIEEVPVATPRLVTALVHGKPVAETAAVDTLVGEETRKYKKKGGETFFGVGFMGIAVPGTDVFPGGGMMLRWSFETVDFGVLADLRFAGGSPEDDDAGFFSAGVGGRWFLSDTNWTPFFGVGLGYSALSVHERGVFEGSQAGLGGWVEFGVEALRFYESRLSVDLRAELPFYDLEREGWFSEGKDDSYYLPITLGVTYLW